MAQMMEKDWQQDLPLQRERFEQVCYHAIGLIDRNREYLQMHLAASGEECVQEALKDIENETVQLERTLEELMSVLKLHEEEETEPKLVRVDLCGFLGRLARLSTEIERQTGIRFSVEGKQEEECIVRAVPRELEQLLQHLVSNALRACTAGGQVTVRLSREDDLYLLTVADDGCGLPTEKHWLENRRRFLGGAQAGLLLCRAYCSHAGWDFSLSDRPRGGVQASVSIPACTEEPPLEGTIKLCQEHESEYDHLHWLIRRELCLLELDRQRGGK